MPVGLSVQKGPTQSNSEQPINELLHILLFSLKSDPVSSVRGHLPTVPPYYTVPCINEKKSFVYSEGNRSLLTHPPQLLVSQHNGWMITPHKNQSVNI